MDLGGSDLRVSDASRLEREAGAGVEFLYRDSRAASLFASLSDPRETPFDLLSDVLSLNS